MDEMLDLIMDGALKMGLNLTEGQALQICRYHDMLTRANAVTNLTRVPDDPREAVDRNYLDALTPLAHARLTDGVRTLCDAGSGAGIPGIVLSIALPDSVTNIGADAFERHANLTLIVGRGSYAERYARENGLKYNYTDAAEWLADDQSEEMGS